MLSGVFWLERGPGDPPAAPPPLAIVLCPRGDDNLEIDLRRMKEQGVEAVVSMLESHEARFLGLAEEGAIARKLGLDFLSFPIPDRNVPANLPAFRAFVSGLAERLRKGQRVAVHCRGSIGRAPLASSCVLIHLGWDAGEALDEIHVARGFPVPDTEEQERWILSYQAHP